MAERQTRFDIPQGSNTSRGWSTSQSTIRPSPSPNVRVSRKAVSSSPTGTGSRKRNRSPSHLTSNSPSHPNPNSSPAISPSSTSTSSSSIKSKFLLSRDYRESLPPILTRFIGYRPPGDVPPYEPLNIIPFRWLKHIPLKYEIWIFSFVGSLIGILLIESICSTNTIFRSVYKSPLSITSFGAAAILLFGVIESPLAQPRNHILGNLLGSIIGVGITKLFTLTQGRRLEYIESLENHEFHGRSSFINGGLVVSITLLVTQILGVVHPPAGATALAAAIDPHILPMSWNHIPVVLSSSLLVIAWALIINNLGRRRYPVYWWTPQRYFVRPDDEEEDEPQTQGDNTNDNGSNDDQRITRIHSRGRGRARESEELALKTLEEGTLRKLEDGGRSPEALLIDRLQGHGGSIKDIKNASDGYFDDGSRDHGHNHDHKHDHSHNQHHGDGNGDGHNRWVGVHEPLGKILSREDRLRAEGIEEGQEEQQEKEDRES